MQVLQLNTPLTTLEDAIGKAKSWYPSFEGELMPTMLSYTKSECMLVALPSLGDRENGGREHSIEFAKMFNTIFDIHIYCLLMESYVLKQESKEADMSKWVGRLKDHPDAVEKLTIVVCSGDKNVLVSYDITKDRQLINEEKFDGVGGDFVEMGAMKNIPSEAKSYLRARFMQDFKMSPGPKA